MRPILGRVATALVAGLAWAALMPACAKNDESIFIRGILAPSSNRQGGVCTYTADPTQPELFLPLLDVGVRDNYFAVLLIANQLIQRGDPTSPTAEANRIHINGVVVDLTNPDGSSISSFTSFATGLVDPQQNNIPSFAPVGAAIVDAPTAAKLLAQIPNRVASKTILANIKAFGTTLGGTDIESGEFQTPIQVCNGCTIDFSTGNDPSQQPQPNCLKPLDTTTASTTTGPCLPGQDGNISCQQCLALQPTNPRCQPTNP